MDPFRRLAVFTLARDASFVALAASTFMLGFSFAPALAFGIGAHIALIFAVALLVRARWLSAERIVRSEPWRALEPNERPAGKSGRQLAHALLEDLLLRFAKAAASVAIALYSASLLVSVGHGARSAHEILTASLN
jgi:hypothetical protein